MSALAQRIASFAFPYCFKMSTSFFLTVCTRSRIINRIRLCQVFEIHHISILLLLDCQSSGSAIRSWFASLPEGLQVIANISKRRKLRGAMRKRKTLSSACRSISWSPPHIELVLQLDSVDRSTWLRRIIFMHCRSSCSAHTFACSSTRSYISGSNWSCWLVEYGLHVTRNPNAIHD
jgi:hypothetical protein